MRYVLPSIQNKYKGEAPSKSSSNLASQDIPEVINRSRIVITQPPKKLRVEECWGSLAVEGSFGSSQCLDKREGAEVASSLALLPAPEKPLQMPGSRINDPQFLVHDVVNHHLDQALCLSPCFSLPIQAIYTNFHQDSWDRFAEIGLLKCQCVTVMCQVSVCFASSLIDSHVCILVFYIFICGMSHNLPYVV